MGAQTPTRWRAPTVRYGFAVAAVVLAAGVRLALVPVLGDRTPFVTFFPAVVLTAWFGGLGPALVATALGLVGAFALFLEPGGLPVPGNLDSRTAVALYLVASLTMGWLTASMRAAQARAEVTAAAVREREERYRRLVEASPIAVCVHRADRITFVNPAAQRLFGASDPAQLLGRVPLELFHADCHAAVRRRTEEVVRQGRPLGPLDEKVVRLDGAAVDVLVTATVHEAGPEPAVQVLVQDVSGLRQAEAEVRRLNEQLERRVAERTAELQEALASVRQLHGLLPICAWCKKVRDDQDYWHEVETYVMARSEARFTHGICPECMKRQFPGGPGGGGPG